MRDLRMSLLCFTTLTTRIHSRQQVNPFLAVSHLHQDGYNDLNDIEYLFEVCDKRCEPNVIVEVMERSMSHSKLQQEGATALYFWMTGTYNERRQR